MKYIIAHDFGTSSAKASLFQTDGTLIASAAETYHTYYEFPQYAEQDAEDWWTAFCKNNKRILKNIDRADIAAVSFSSAFPNCLLVDKDRKPLHRALIWQDSRAIKEAREISRLLPEKYTKRAPGGVLSPDRSLSKLLWIKAHNPEVYAKADKLLACAGDYIILKLIGKAVCEYNVSYGTAMIQRGTKEWSEEILHIAGIDAGLMPELHDRTDIVGTVGEAAAEECGLPAGTKIVCGTVDSDCTCIGGGLRNPGDAFLLGGTSAEIDALDQNGRKIGRPSNSSGAALNWMRDIFAIPELAKAKQENRDVFDLINEIAAQREPGSGGVIFLPYLAGERGVRYDSWAKGSFYGLSLSTSREDMIRAVVEGVGYNLNLMLQQIRDAGVEVTRLPVVGGLGKGREVLQIFADIMNVTFLTFEHMDQAAVVGAAVIAGMGIGIYEDVSAAEQFMHVKDVIEPNLENHEIYKRYIRYFEEVYQALKPITERFGNGE